jgi:hypothetical protein
VLSVEGFIAMDHVYREGGRQIVNFLITHVYRERQWGLYKGEEKLNRPNIVKE